MGWRLTNNKGRKKKRFNNSPAVLIFDNFLSSLNYSCSPSLAFLLRVFLGGAGVFVLPFLMMVVQSFWWEKCEKVDLLAAFSGLVLESRKNENRVGVKRTSREHTYSRKSLGPAAESFEVFGRYPTASDCFASRFKPHQALAYPGTPL